MQKYFLALLLVASLIGGVVARAKLSNSVAANLAARMCANWDGQRSIGGVKSAAAKSLKTLLASGVINPEYARQLSESRRAQVMLAAEVELQMLFDCPERVSKLPTLDATKYLPK